MGPEASQILWHQLTDVCFTSLGTLRVYVSILEMCTHCDMRVCCFARRKGSFFKQTISVYLFIPRTFQVLFIMPWLLTRTDWFFSATSEHHNQLQTAQNRFSFLMLINVKPVSKHWLYIIEQTLGQHHPPTPGDNICLLSCYELHSIYLFGVGQVANTKV